MALSWPANARDVRWPGHFIALTLGQQRFLKTVGVRHGEVLADTDAGLAPEEAARLNAGRPAAATA
jgi:hypothetical protein